MHQLTPPLPEQLKIKLQGIENAFGFIEHQQFLCFRDPIRTEVMKASKDCVKTDWESVKKAFLLNYEPRITARTTCTNLANMAQRAGKVANRHHLRLFATFDKLQSTFPKERKAVRFAPANAATARAAEDQTTRH